MGKNKEIAKQSQEIVKEIDPAAFDIINSLPEEQKSVLLRSMTIAEYHGPIPPPALLKQYNEIIPDAADRILKMAEEEQRQRHNSVNWMVKSSVTRRMLGLLFGTFIIAAILYFVFNLAVSGHDTVACTLATVTTIGLAVIFILNREPSSSKDKKNKNN